MKIPSKSRQHVPKQLDIQALQPELDLAEPGNCIFHITGEFPNTRLL